MTHILGIDIGGTKVRFGVVNELGDVIEDRTRPAEHPFYPFLESEILSLIEQYPAISGIGIGTRGMVDAETGVITFEAGIIPGWQGTPVKELLEKATGRRVEVNNDANVAGLAEAMLGAGKGYRNVLCMTIGTGLGGGIIFDGHIVNGAHGGAGEIGHVLLYPNGKICSCGRPGCAEQYISGTALREAIQELGVTDEKGDLIAPHQLFSYAKSGNEKAFQIQKKFVSDLAIMISSMQAVLDMDCVVIGGGVSESADDWWAMLEEMLEPLLLKPLVVKRAIFGNEAGMLGATQLIK